jgi:hypothetical protein
VDDYDDSDDDVDNTKTPGIMLDKATHDDNIE